MEEKELDIGAFDKLPPGYDEDPQKVKWTKQNQFKKPKDLLSGNMAAIFVNSAVTGSAIISLPFALKESGWFGVFMILLCGINSLYCGMAIGWCWIILQERWPEYKKRSRSPYSEIAYRVAGTWLKYIVMVIVDFNQLIFCLVYMTLIAQLIEEVSLQELKYCYVFVVCIFLLIPLTWLGTPKDFWVLAVIDILASALFIAVTLVAIFIDKSRVGTFAEYNRPEFVEFATSYGSIIFAFTGGAVQPTIQIDMNNRKIFPQSIFTGYLIILLLYVPVPILGYAAYGEGTSYNILENIAQNPGSRAVVIFLYVVFLIHMCMTTIIHLNPVFQNLEELLNIPTKFGYKRCLLRSGVMVALLPVGFAIPYFSLVMKFSGALTINLLTTIFPIVFYVCLIYQKGNKKNNRKINKKKGAFLSEIAVLGILGIIATYLTASEKFEKMGKLNINCYTSNTVSNITDLWQTKNNTHLRQQYTLKNI